MISGVMGTYITAPEKPRKSRPTNMIQILFGRPPKRRVGPTNKSVNANRKQPPYKI